MLKVADILSDLTSLRVGVCWPHAEMVIIRQLTQARFTGSCCGDGPRLGSIARYTCGHIN